MQPTIAQANAVASTSRACHDDPDLDVIECFEITGLDRLRCVFVAHAIELLVQAHIERTGRQKFITQRMCRIG